MTLLAGAHPSGVAEGDALHGDVTNRALGSTYKFDKCLQNGHDGLTNGLTREGHIV